VKGEDEKLTERRVRKSRGKGKERKKGDKGSYHHIGCIIL